MEPTIGNLLAEIGAALRTADGRDFAVFDFDNTCIVNDIGEATLAYLCRNSLLKDKTLSDGTDAAEGDYSGRVFRHYYRLLDEGRVRDAYVLCAQMLSGFSVQEAESLARAVINYEGSKIGTQEVYGLIVARGLAARPSVRELLRFLDEKGLTIWVISASPEPLVRAAMGHFGLPGKVIGIRHRLQSGLLGKELEPPLSMMEGKVACIQAFIDPQRQPLLVVGDSLNDLPMLEQARIKAVVDRQNKFTHEARARGWHIIV